MVGNVNICHEIQFAIKCVETTQKRVPIIFSVPANPELSEQLIQTDKQWLTDNMLCLLSNAVKFTESGCITVACSFEDGMVLVEVEDSGIGISPDIKQKLFQPFQQENHYAGKRLHPFTVIVKIHK